MTFRRKNKNPKTTSPSSLSLLQDQVFDMQSPQPSANGLVLHDQNATSASLPSSSSSSFPEGHLLPVQHGAPSFYSGQQSQQQLMHQQLTQQHSFHAPLGPPQAMMNQGIGAVVYGQQQQFQYLGQSQSLAAVGSSMQAPFLSYSFNPAVAYPSMPVLGGPVLQQHGSFGGKLFLYEGQIGTMMPSQASHGGVVHYHQHGSFASTGGMPHFVVPQDQVGPAAMHAQHSTGGVVHHQHESFAPLPLSSYPMHPLYANDPFYGSNHHGGSVLLYGHQ
jgi:hypothetical protein